MTARPVALLRLILLVAFFALVRAAQAREKEPAPIEPDGIPGSLVLGGGGKLPEVVWDRFVEMAGGKAAHLVIIPTASATAEKLDAEKYLAPWKSRNPASVVLLHTRDRKLADDEKFLAPLRKATGVWFGGGDQAKLTAAYRGTRLEKELTQLLKRDGVIGGSSAGAAVQTRLMITGGADRASVGEGFDLLPGCVVDQHFSQRKREKRLFDLVQKNPHLVGVGIDEGTALFVRGRRLWVVGEGKVHFRLAASSSRPARTITVSAGGAADLTALRRAAAARQGPAFPPREPGVPQLTRGSLVIVGGGGSPPDVLQKFIELAGGADALIVVIPVAQQPLPSDQAAANALRRAGARNVQLIKARHPSEADSTQVLELLGKARGVWFGGGRQWRLVDAYFGTKAHAALHGVLQRGGVIGGTSAGASIQGDYLCRGDPLGNRAIMAEGYERGLAFLPGTAIDQHFAQRKRFDDMSALMRTYPQLLGIGIDEATALVVQGSVGQVMGRGQVHFYDVRKPVQNGQPGPVSVKAGGRYDLKARRLLAGDK